MRGPSIPMFRSGQEVTSESLNALARAVNGMRGITGGPGVKVLGGSGGLVVSLDLGVTPFVFGRISDVAGGAGPDAASAFTYEFTAFGRPELPVYTGLTPSGGRPVITATPLVYPCPVGEWAILILEPTGDGTTAPKLYLLCHERIAWGDCDGTEITE